MLGRFFRWVRSWFRDPPCDRCGRPASVLFFDAQPIRQDATSTTLRARNVRRLCPGCLRWLMFREVILSGGVYADQD